jgi:flagellar biosynthetic protein FliQ
MNEDMIIKLSKDSLQVISMVSGPLLISTLVLGLLISVFQALTQIQEATLTFVPKLIMAALVLIIAGPWMLDILVSFTTELFSNIAEMVRN